MMAAILLLIAHRLKVVNMEEGNWFERNPNWTWLIAVIPLWLAVFVMTIIILCIAAISESLGTLFMFLIFVPHLTFNYWMLRVKNRSLWWTIPVMILWFILPLLENRGKFAMKQTPTEIPVAQQTEEQIQNERAFEQDE